MEGVHCHIARRPVPPAERIKNISAPVSRLVMRMLAKTAEERYQTAAGVEARPNALEADSLFVVERLALPRPEQRSELRHDREGDAVVDRVQVAARDRQEVTALAVRVVHDRVEDRHPAQRGQVAADERRQVHLGVDVHPQLHHAGAEGPVAQHGGRDHAPAGRLRHQVGRDLPAGERIAVCVSEDPRAAGLVRYAKRLADSGVPNPYGPLRELVRQYRQEGIVARRNEIRRIRQARLFWPAR